MRNVSSFSALFQPEGLRRANMGSPPGRDERCRKAAGRQDQCWPRRWFRGQWQSRHTTAIGANFPSAATQGSAIATPTAIIMPASQRMSRIAEPPLAPRARRMPISRVRRVTTNETTPYRPINDSRRARAPKAPESIANIRSVLSERLICSSRVRKEMIGNCGSAWRTIFRID